MWMTVALAVPSLIVWCEFIAQDSAAVSITSNTATTLLVAGVAGSSLSVALHTLRLLRIPLGLSRGLLHVAQLVPVLYALAVLLGCPLVSVAAFAWAVYVALCFGLHERTTLSAMQQRLRGSTVGLHEILEAAGSPLAMALLWSWIGAWAVPLDWDRSWQPFPISSALLTAAAAPVCVGAARLMQTR